VLARDAIARKVGKEDGAWPAYAWPGGYPIFYLMDDSGTLCAQCMNTQAEVHFTGDHDGWLVDDADVHWEGPELVCDHCNQPIPSAYGDPDGDDS
jgi:hypothetical protein